MKHCSAVFASLFLLSAVNCLADLVPIAPVGTNQVPTSGAGYGNVLTLLNAHNSSGSLTDGLETNCDIISGGSVVSECSGPFASLTLHDAGNQNHAQSIGATGITDSTLAASELLLVFNTNQTGPHAPSDESITLDALGLALWWNGSLIYSTVTTVSDTYLQTLQGVGQAGWGYQLDSSQAADAQTAIDAAIAGGATLNNILVTGAFTAGCLPGTTFCANDGPETLFLDAHGAGVIPEPASVIMLGTVLFALSVSARRWRKA
jgi:hypothetical protein